MKYCLECDAEYLDEVTTCADCSCPLVDGDEYRRRKEERDRLQEALRSETFVPVLIADNPFEADRAKEALEQEGIPVLLRTFEDTAYNGIYVAQKGWGYVEVPSSQKTKAEWILQEMETIFRQGACESDLVLVCTACGKEVGQESAVCPYCGKSLAEPSEDL